MSYSGKDLYTEEEIQERGYKRVGCLIVGFFVIGLLDNFITRIAIWLGWY